MINVSTVIEGKKSNLSFWAPDSFLEFSPFLPSFTSTSFFPPAASHFNHWNVLLVLNNRGTDILIACLTSLITALCAHKKPSLIQKGFLKIGRTCAAAPSRLQRQKSPDGFSLRFTWGLVLFQQHLKGIWPTQTKRLKKIPFKVLFHKCICRGSRGIVSMCFVPLGMSSPAYTVCERRIPI